MGIASRNWPCGDQKPGGKDANRWMIDQIREVKKNFPIPHLDRKGVSIDDFQLKPDESGNYR